VDSSLTPLGSLAVTHWPAPPARPAVRTVAEAIRYGASRSLLTRRGRWQRRNAANFQRSIMDQALFEDQRLPAIGHLWGRVLHRDGNVTDLGLMSCRVVTTAGVNFLVDALQGLVEPELMRYHGVGTGTTAENVANTALVTELTTQYGTANTRPTGTLGEKTGSPNVFETAATITVSAAVAVTEHGIFSQAAAPGGTLLDRSVFAAVNLASGESLQATYQLTLPSGG
jgi:hypothetical protein